MALAEAVPDASLRPAGFALAKGEEIDLGDVAELLVGCGYERVEQVDDRGQFAVRGGILDVFGSTEDQAARIELFGDEIESIRYFSTFTQRSLARPSGSSSPRPPRSIPITGCSPRRPSPTPPRTGRSGRSPSSCPPIASVRSSS